MWCPEKASESSAAPSPFGAAQTFLPSWPPDGSTAGPSLQVLRSSSDPVRWARRDPARGGIEVGTMKSPRGAAPGVNLVIALLAAVLLGNGTAFARGGGGHSGGGRSGGYVHGYTRHDGTYVAPYWRGPVGSGRSHGSSSSGSSVYHSPSSRTWSTPQGTATLSTIPRHRPSERAQGVARDRHGRIQRSASAKDYFKHEHPCPSTGRTLGSCPGYVIDHIIPLKRGGPDAPVNMQWQTIGDAKAKDRWE
jgi:hypothetical protein